MFSMILRTMILCFLPVAALAAKNGFGGVAQNMMEPVNLMSDFVNTACFIIGGSFMFASIIKYIEHKRSPLMVSISTVIFLFIGGLVLVLLPFTYMLTENGIHYSLFR